MKTATITAIVVTGVIVLLAAAATGFAGFMMWALALNGFMGQERAVSASMMTYFVLAGLTAIVTIALSAISVYFLSGRRQWNAAVSALLSIVVFVTATGVLHTLCVVVSAIVADQMRTNR